MKFDPANATGIRPECTPRSSRSGLFQRTTGSSILSSSGRHGIVENARRAGRLSLSCVVAAMLTMGAAIPASAQTLAALDQPPTLMQAPAKPMTPARIAWLKGRCAQLVAFFDYYGVSRGENSDGARNHTRIGATIECSEAHYRTGIDTMAALLKRKAFTVPKPGTPVLEPEDEVPDVTNPTQQRY